MRQLERATPQLVANPYAGRLQRTREEMTRQGIDLLVVGPSADLFYLTGHAGHESERMSVLVLPRDGTPRYVVPVLEAPLLQDQQDLCEIVSWAETADPARAVANAAGAAASGTVAVSDELWSVFTLRLQQAMPLATWREGGQLLRPLRMIKEERELALLAEAARRTDETWEAFLDTAISGLAEWEVRDRLLGFLAARELTPVFCNVGSGPNGASPHQTASVRAIRPGDAIVCDWGGTLEGYNSDVTRTAHVGEPSDAFVRAYEAVLAANDAAFAAVRPGTPCQEIDRAARDVLTAAGYGDAFIHRTGHGLGLSLHEEPYLVAGNTLPLQEGMVFSDEPGVYFPGEFGIRIEDTVVCTADGGRRLNGATRELIVMK
jgi:Xaa-Pro aminopeptidase